MRPERALDKSPRNPFLKDLSKPLKDIAILIHIKNMPGRITQGLNRQRPLNTRQVRQVSKIINSQRILKRKLTMFNSFAVSTTGSLIEISAIAEGDDYQQRTGDIILALKASFSLAFQAGDVTNLLRVMLVRAKFGSLDVSQMPAIGNEADQDRMQVYFDKHWFMDNVGIVTLNDVQHVKSFTNRKVPGLNIKYDDTTSATAAQSNALYIYFVSDSGTAPHISAVGHVLLKYFDKN